VLLVFSAFGALIMGSTIYWLSKLSDQPNKPRSTKFKDRAGESCKPL
jgi:hypothetical protein